MIAIPNMEKPKECKECQWHLDFYIEDEQVGGLCTITEKDDRENTCPLIEIDENDPMLLEFLNEFDKWRVYKELMDSIRMAQKKGEANDKRYYKNPNEVC